MSERRGSEGTQEVPGATHDNCSTQGKHVRPPSARHASPSACRRSRRRAAGRRAPELAAGVKMRQERTARTSPLLPGRIASGGYRRADPAVRQGARADDAGRRVPRDRAPRRQTSAIRKLSPAQPRHGRAGRASASR